MEICKIVLMVIGAVVVWKIIRFGMNVHGLIKDIDNDIHSQQS